MPRPDLSGEIRKLAESGDPFAQFELATDFDYGNGIEQDFLQAQAWYERARKSGHRAAELNLLLMHVIGQAETLPANVVMSRLKALARTGDVSAINNLGLCFQRAYGTEQNFVEAEKLYRKAAETGSPPPNSIWAASILKAMD